jgi:uncharacterized protein
MGRNDSLMFLCKGKHNKLKISILKNGIDKRDPDNFNYIRIDTQLDESCPIEMDETDKEKLKKLAEKANIEFQNNATNIINNFGTGTKWSGHNKKIA